MTDWADDLTRVHELRGTVEAKPAAVASSAGELLELARSEEWSVQRAAVDALGVGLVGHPEAGVPELDALVRTALDADVPSPGRWRAGLVAVAGTAPEAVRDAAFDGFAAVPPDRRDDAGGVARALERIALEDPPVLADSGAKLRAICRASAPRGRRHLLGAHLALVEGHREAVRPVCPDLLAEFEAGSGDSRRVAADLLCALATHPEDGQGVVETMVRWLATHPRYPREHRPWLGPRDSVVQPSLTDGPPSGILGVTQVLARIAEEAPHAVAPHCGDIAGSLAAWESTQGDQWPRSHLARALAAVARQRPRAAVSTAEAVRSTLDDDSEFVRYWAARTLLALSPYRPGTVSPAVVGTLLTDTNRDVRSVGADLAEACVADGIVDSDGVVAELRAALSDATEFRERRALGVLESVARHDPDAVRPLVPTLAGYLDAPLTANKAAAVFETIATDDPEAVADAVPTLVDCLFTDSPSVRTAAADALSTVGTERPSLLDDQLPALSTVAERAHDGLDAAGDVLVTVPDRPLEADHTVFGFVRARSTDDVPPVRRRATRLLGAFVEADTRTEAAVTALADRLDDADAQVRETALDALATYVAETGAASLVRSCYETGTDHWRAVSANLLARATLYDAAWPDPDFHRWLADRLRETAGETRRSFVDATRYVCGQTDAEAALVEALLDCLDDDAVAATAFAAVRDAVTDGATTVPAAELAPAVERTVLDPDQHAPSACLTLIPHVATELAAPQRVADRLVARLAARQGDAGTLSAVLAGLCSCDVTLPASALVAALDDYAAAKPVSARDWTCKHFGRVLRVADGDTALRETFVPMAGESDGGAERRATAYSVLASVAEVWPAAVELAADTLRAGVRADDERVSGPALSALVAVGREFPAVLRPIAGWLTSRRASLAGVELRRRRYEALALLAADEAALGTTVARTLRRGLLDDDTAVREFALEATAELDDARLVPLLRRLDDGVPDWDSLPTHCRSASGDGTEPPLGELLPSDERTLTAGDALDRLSR